MVNASLVRNEYELRTCWRLMVVAMDMQKKKRKNKRDKDKSEKKGEKRKKKLTIANRLKNILPSPVGENQSVFVPNRLIIDNALIAFECFHYMKNKDKGRKGFIGLKLDMSKPYDRVEWCFFGKCAWGYGISKRLDFLHNDMC